MKRFGLTVAALALSALAFASSADAQTRFGLAAGLAVPTGDFGDFVGTGFNIEGNAEFRPGTMPFAIRADLSYNRFSVDDPGDGNVTAFGGALNALFQMAGISATPYLLVGPTFTNLSADIDGVDTEDENKIGVQGGIGVKFPLSGFTSKIEARYHTIFTDDDNTNMFIINFGILSGGR